MKRRTLLRAAGATTALGSATLNGCLGLLAGADGPCGGSESGREWCRSASGDLDAVRDGTLYVRTRSEGSNGEAKRSVVALDAETGDREWSYGTARGGYYYPELAVDDGVFFGRCGDDDCESLVALDRGGEERWTRDVGSGHRRPVVADGIVYVANGSTMVRALDAATGDTRWDHQVQSSLPTVVDVADEVVVRTDAGLVALDPADGSVRWRYAPEGDPVVADAMLSKGVAYLATFDGVTAVVDGEAQWSQSFASDAARLPEIEGVASERLLVKVQGDRNDHRVSAFDLSDGTLAWTSDPIVEPGVAVRDDAVYVAREQLRALDAATGAERWSESVDGGPIYSATIVPGAGDRDHAVLAWIGDHRLATYDPAGERTWSASVDTELSDVLVEDRAYVATADAVLALDRTGNAGQ